MIKTEKEYEQALKDLEVLLFEVEAYEEEHYPIDEPSEEARAEFRKEQE